MYANNYYLSLIFCSLFFGIKMASNNIISTVREVKSYTRVTERGRNHLEVWAILVNMLGNFWLKKKGRTTLIFLFF